MNLPTFLKGVDDLAAGLPKEQLQEFIHELARTLPEEKRNYFMNTLRSAGHVSEKPKLPDTIKNDGYSEFAGEIQEIKKKLIKINEGDCCLDSECNQEWDDWYNSDADEVLFTDPEGILRDINRAMALMHTCVDREAYKEGCELAELLSVLEVSADGDYSDCNGSPLSIHELSGYGLLSHDFKHFVKESLYLTYMGNELKDRADELFCTMGNFECYEVCMEDILQSGNEELPQFQEFLTLWISYLGDQKGRNAEKFLKEAQMMLQDEERILENARRFVNVHPALYEQLLRMKLASGENDKMLQIGKEALDKINSSYTIRSDIALLAAEYACRLKDYHEAEQCWLEAFRSNSAVTNYMRVRFCSRDWLSYAADVKQIYGRIYNKSKQNSIYDRDAQRENDLHKNGYCVMLFFDEQFDTMRTTGMAEKKALGWSATFMKEGLALILLLLYKGTELPKGLASMLSRAVSACDFKTVEYCRGIGKNIERSDHELFWELFCQWKSNVQMSEHDTKKWLDRINQWISLRVAGIMENNRRNYYGECASYIAAFGEVQESMGIPFAKSDIMEKYKSEYSRRRAFHQELRDYGMKR